MVVAALVRPDGWTARELARSDVEWVTPSFLFDELEEHSEEYAAKIGCPQKEWQRRVASLAKRFRIVPASDVVEARGALIRRVEHIDQDDVPYVAAAIATEADLFWTRDRALLAALPGFAVSVVPRAAGGVS